MIDTKDLASSTVLNDIHLFIRIFFNGPKDKTQIKTAHLILSFHKYLQIHLSLFAPQAIAGISKKIAGIYKNKSV